jgi:adenine-specific DNA-methyltransferase
MRFSKDGQPDQSPPDTVRPLTAPVPRELRAPLAPLRVPPRERDGNRENVTNPNSIAQIPSQRFFLDTVAQGDCVQVMRQMPAASVDFILTDPPYLVNYRSRDGRAIHNDVDNRWLKPSFVQAHRVLRPDRFCVSFYGWSKADQFIAAWREAGFRLVGHLVFRKSYTSATRFLRYQHEQAYLLAKGDPALPEHPIADVREMRYTGNKIHPTQKDIAALLPLIESFSSEGDLVLDPFCSSGSTLIAARCLRRHFFGIEIDPAYHALAVRRTAQTIDRGVQPEGNGKKEKIDRESPHPARASQKLTVESGPRAAMPDRERQIQR